MVAFDLPMPAHRRPALAILNHAIVGTPSPWTIIKNIPAMARGSS